MRKLRICYFLPHKSPHSKRFLKYFYDKGHELFFFHDRDFTFYSWESEMSDGPSIRRRQREEVIDVRLDRKARIEAYTPGVFVAMVRLLLRYIRYILKLFTQFVPSLDRTIDEIVFYLRRASRLKRSINLIRPDIVHGQYLTQNAIDVKLSGFKPNVLTAWGSDIRDLDPLTKIQRLYRDTALKKASAVTAPSRDLLDLCREKGAGEDRCYEIAMPGIDIPWYQEKISAQGIYDKLRIPKNVELIFSPRAMGPLYRIESIVDAFYHVKKQLSSSYLLLMDFNSDPDYLEKVRDLISEKELQNDTAIVSQIPNKEMRELYAISSVVVSIPENDGMPQTVYEAFAAGCPVISADLVTYKELIIDRVSGLLVSGENIIELADTIVELLKDDSLRFELVKNGKRIVAERGDLFVEMSRMESLYYGLVEPENSF